MKILMIEDSEPDRVLIKESFDNCTYYTILDYAEDASEALNYLSKTIPDLILLDLNLPKVSGFDLLEKLKKNPKYKEIPVIILTASNNVQYVKMAYKLYANSYITKPMDAENFLRYWFEVVEL